MKKITLLILLGFLATWCNYGQVYVGTQSGTTNAMPINSCYEYSYSQQLVYKTDINGTAGNITSISFYYDRTTGANVNSSDWTIYLGHTSKTDFSNDTDWVPVSELTEVFSGTVTYPAPGNWMEITFSTPFAYNNVDNLVIAVDENQPGDDCTNYFGKTGAMGAGRSIYARSDTDNIDPASPPTATARANFINNMILGGLQESCPRPTGLTVTGGTDTTADLNWTENGSATQWEILYGPSGFNPYISGTLLLDDDGTPGITVTGLEENTLYDFYVRAICGASEQSALVGPTSYNTACGISSAPWAEGFESGFTDQQPLGGCWSQASVTGSDGWVTNSSMTTYNRSPRSGNWNITLRYSNEDYIFYPLSLTGGTPYELQFYARQDGSNGSNASIMAAYGTADNAAAMTNIIVPESPLVDGDYQEFSDYFTPTTSGIYYIGIKGKINGSPWYISLDDISVEEASGCLRPGTLSVVDVTDTTANISWVPNGSATEWEVIYDLAGFDPLTGGTTVTVNTTPATTLTGLTSNTAYDFYVRTICGTEQSLLSGPKNFRTACDTVTTLPYLENFDTYGTGPQAFPACWERITYTSGSDIWPSIVSGNATSAPNSLKFQSATGTPTYAISPPFAEDIQNLQVSFMLKREGASSGTMDVGVMSNPLDPSTFELVQTINPANNDYIEYEFNLNNVTLSGGNNYIALRQNSNSNIWYYWLDDFMVQTIPTCPKPIDLTVDSVETTTANISWTAGSTETEWNISWGTPGYTVGGAGELGSATSNTESFQITGLNPSTRYEFYVQANCGAGDLSIWSGPISFFTACDAVTTLPYLENFDTYGTGPQAFPPCWERITYTTGSNIWPSIVSGNATSAPNSLKFQSQEGIPTYAISPPFAEDIQNLQVSFMLKREGASSGTIDVGVMSDPLDPNTFELVQTINPDNNDYMEYEFNLNNVTLSGGNNHIALRQNSNSSIWYYWLDDFMVQNIPSCPKPIDLMVDALSSTTAGISWTPGSNETEWNVIYGETGFDPATGGTTIVVQNTPETTITGLTQNTIYDFYVQAVCGSDDESILNGPVTFRTSCVPEGIPFTEGFESGYIHDEILNGCWSQASIVGSNQWTVNSTNTTYNRTPRTGNYNVTLRYGNEDWMFYPLDLEQGTAYKLTFYARQDGSNPSNASIMAAFGTVNTPAGMTIPIIPNTPLVNGNYQEFVDYFTVPSSGVYYLGIKGTINSSPWYISLDDISVVESTECLSPREVFVDGTTETTADVYWTQRGPETEWDIVYGPVGFNPETEGTIVNVTGGVPEATITGLTPSTSYEFYVRAVCGPGEVTSWTGPGSFDTQCVLAELPYLIDFQGTRAPELPACTSVETIGNGNGWESANVNENGFTGKALRYKWSPTSAANTWFYTNGINMVAGTEYKISYKYGNNSANHHEKMKVAYGTAPAATYMTNELADYTDITGGEPNFETITFTVPEDGVYYFGFKAYSASDQFYLFVDDIYIQYAAPCEAVTNVVITDITDTTVTVSWTASSTAADGYTVDVYTQGANPSLENPLASTSVAAGVTTATVNGLQSNTAYDVYVVSNCGGGNMIRTQGIQFTTTNLRVADSELVKITIYPNPVKDQLNISSAKTIESIAIYNLLGQRVMDVRPNDLNVVIDMSLLSSGTYILKASVMDATSTYKVVKE